MFPIIVSLKVANLCFVICDKEKMIPPAKTANNMAHHLGTIYMSVNRVEDKKIHPIQQIIIHAIGNIICIIFCLTIECLLYL